MRSQVLTALVNLLNVRTDAQRENLETIRWYRQNADARRGKPHHAEVNQEDVQVRALVGALSHAVTNGTTVSSDSSGQASQSTDTSTSTASVEHGTAEEHSGRQPQPDPTPAPKPETSGGSDQQTSSGDGGVSPNHGSGGSAKPPDSTPGTTGQGVSGGSGLQGWKRYTAITVAALASGGVGAAVYNQFFTTDINSGGTTVIEGEYPLLDWLEEKGHHLSKD